MLPKVTPNLWFDGNAAEAVEFYASLFPGARIIQTVRYPDEGLPDFQQGMAGKPLTVDFQLRDLRFVAINAGPEFKPNSSVSFMVTFDPSEQNARTQIDTLWAGLLDGGKVHMPLGEYPFSPYYGWVEDRYGFSWQLILTAPGSDTGPTIIPCLLFGGPNQNRALEAISYYASALPSAQVGDISMHADWSDTALADSVAFGQLSFWDQQFAVMDRSVEQDATFNEAVSFAVMCADQEEIDTLWAVLSTVPEAEQCGWCKDKFGLSWQIVPENMGDLMSRPNAYQHMLAMKKLVIADF